MLKPEHRLSKVRDFNLLMTSGRWLKGNFLDVRYSALERVPEGVLPKRVKPAEFQKQLKIAFTVGLKVDKRAVVRNRARRQIREIVRLLIKEGKIKIGYYILLVARKEIVGKEYKEIQEEIEKLLRGARILIEAPHYKHQAPK